MQNITISIHVTVASNAIQNQTDSSKKSSCCEEHSRAQKIQRYFSSTRNHSTNVSSWITRSPLKDNQKAQKKASSRLAILTLLIADSTNN